MRTQRAEVHEAGEGDDPKPHAVDYITTIELEGEPVLATWVNERSIKQTANQKTVGQQIVQEKHDIGGNSERLGFHDQLVSKRSGWYHALAWELAVINVGNGKNVEVHRGEHCNERERDCGVGYESPLDTTHSAMDGVEQRGHALEEQHDDDP